MARRGTIHGLDEHPNAPEITCILARIPHIADDDLPRLAAAWRNTVSVAEARAKALEPDSPLVFDVLATFDAVQDLWADELAGSTALDSEMTAKAMKAVRDAIAAAYGKPVLSRGQHAMLLRPWRSVYRTDGRSEPDLGRRGAEVKGLLHGLRWLATRCHDAAAAERYEQLVDLAWVDDEDLRRSAREEAWTAATLTGRKRTWGLLRRNGAEGLTHPCNRCGRRPSDTDLASVMTLCLDAACALLVADAISEALLDSLTRPVRALIPEPRSAAD